MVFRNRLYKLSNFLIGYLILMIIWPFIVDIESASYNGIFIGLFAIFSFILSQKISTVTFSILFASILFIFSESYIHVLLDILLVIMIFSSLDIALNDSYRVPDIKHLRMWVVALIFLNVLMVFNPIMYTEDDDMRRYEGVFGFGSSNISSSLFGMLGILWWEIEKKITPLNKLTKFLYLNILCFLLIILMSKTRSALFFLPYWLMQIYIFTNKAAFVIGVLGGLAYTIYTYFSNLQELLRLEEDPSSITRMIMYESIFLGIKENHYVIPYGSNSSNIMAKVLTDDENFTVHNDFLRYWYDWGGIFLIFILLIIRRFKKTFQISFELCLIVLGYVSCALHNVLFLPAFWVSFIIIANIKNKDLTL